MFGIRKLTVAFIAALMLQSCTVARYEVRSKLSRNSSHEYSEGCDIRYFVSIAEAAVLSQNRPVPGWMQKRMQEKAREHRNRYIEATQDVFAKKGCVSRNMDHEAGANFKIRISISHQIGALPQEWLTGLSFGLIPSWGIRPGTFIYTFENTSRGRGYTYFIDKKSFSHILLFPIAWVTFINLNEMNIYKETLANFIEGS